MTKPNKVIRAQYVSLGHGRGVADVRKQAHQLVGKVGRPTWAALGFDVSYSCIAGVGMMYDGVLDRMRGPATVSQRWMDDEPYFDRCRIAARAENFTLELLSEMGGAVRDIDDIFVAVEEPWPMGASGKSSWLKQQAQFQGVFIGSLLRYGYPNLYEVHNMTWKSPIAKEMDISLKTENFKWIVKQWAIDAYGLPDLPDLITSPKGKKPKPDTSRAKPVQPEDIYDACGVMDWMRAKIEESDLA